MNGVKKEDIYNKVLSYITLLKKNKKYYYSIFFIIIPIILVTSVYDIEYHNSTSLPCNNIQECLLSCSISFLNGYTETVGNNLSNIGSNVYSNVFFTIILLLLIPTVAILTKNEKIIKPFLKIMIIAQILFVLFYGFLMLLLSKYFRGGISLFGVFSLVVIIYMVIKCWYSKYRKLKKINYTYLKYPIAIVISFTFFFYLIGAITIFYKSALNQLLIILGLLTLLLFYFYKKSKLQKQDLSALIIISASIEVLLTSYLFISPFPLNAHSIGLITFIVLWYVSYKLNWFGFKKN